ncbi:MAG: NAD(P)H-dependent oxidoreductase subunit E [Gemmatimonadota bacterium]
MSLIHELEALQAERGHLDGESLRELARRIGEPLYRLQEIVSFYPHFREDPPAARTFHVCRDMSCHLAGADGLADLIRGALGDADVADVAVIETSCLGCCELAPAVRVNGQPAHASDPETLLRSTGNGGPPSWRAPDRVWRADPYAGDREAAYSTFRRVLDSEDLDAALQNVIAGLEEGELRGMGGAGFPTGLKWKIVRAEDATPKYVVCNADESEPGTFKDRVILEQLPYLVVEGMLLGGLTVGASRGIIYLRHEYAAAREGHCWRLSRIVGESRATSPRFPDSGACSGSRL